ncbi:MAG: hypothetical protein ACLQVI_36490 [Polyangiaceae bacterium]
MHLRRSAPFAAFVAVLAASAPALGDVKQECVDASTEGQSLRDAAKLTQARDRFVACARDACPAIVRKACADWLADVDRRIPTVVLRAKLADGTDVVDARVSLDGAPLAHGLGGAAVPIDPGEHTVRFERDGAAPVEEHVVIVEGERDRVVTARFAGPAAAADTSSSTTDEAPSAEGSRKMTPLTIGLVAVGGVGIVSFASFAIVATSNLNNLRQTCAPYCSPSQLNDVKTEALVADISLGVGLVALAAAAYVFFSQGKATPAPAAATSAIVDVRAVPGGGYGAIGVRF